MDIEFAGAAADREKHGAVDRPTLLIHQRAVAIELNRHSPAKVDRLRTADCVRRVGQITGRLPRALSPDPDPVRVSHDALPPSRFGSTQAIMRLELDKSEDY